MINKRFFHYETYARYKSESSEIPQDSIVLIEQTRTLVRGGSEYRCIGEVELSQLDDIRGDDMMTAGDVAGAYLVTNNSHLGGAARVIAGLLMVYNDAMGHATHQVLIGNSVVVSGGVSANHSDTGLTMCWRSYAYLTSGGLVAGKWSDWQEADLHKLAGLTAVVQGQIDAMKDDITALQSSPSGPVEYDAATLTYMSNTLEAYVTDQSWGDADIIWAKTGTVRSNVTTLNLYIQTLLVKAMTDDMLQKGQTHRAVRIKMLPLSVKNLQAGIYISASGGVLTFNQSTDYWSATDSTNRLYYRIYNPAGKAPATVTGMAFDVEMSLWRRGSSSTSYTDVIIRII